MRETIGSVNGLSARGSAAVNGQAAVSCGRAGYTENVDRAVVLTATNVFLELTPQCARALAALLVVAAEICERAGR